jgi:DNA replication protein DnaC
MLHTQTIDGLYALRLEAMAQALADQEESAEYQALSFEDRLGLLVDRELTERENRRRARYLKSAKLRSNAVVEDVDFRRQRGLDRAQVLELAECAWVRNRHQLAIVGATGTGKTFLACALANAAIRRGHNALYLRFPRMLDELAIARVDGRFARLTAAWARIDVLILDDYALRPLSPDQAADTLEVIEDRAGLRSTIFTSQLPIANWHEALGEATIADAVMDRVQQNLHRIELAGESLRKDHHDTASDTATAEPRATSEPEASAGSERRTPTRRRP